jgi:ribosomal-protein-alanine N-acetyltransferase
LATLHSQCFEQGWEAEFFETALQQGVIWVAGDPLAAMLVVQTSGQEAEIITFATAPDTRRQGLARALLTHAIAAARTLGVSHMFLEVARDNDGAQSLYGAAGFEQVGVRKGYYQRACGARVDALVLRLAFGQKGVDVAPKNAHICPL